MHQKAFRFNFRKMNSAGQIKRNYNWIQETGQIQLPVFNADNTTGPANHHLTPSEAGKELRGGSKALTPGPRTPDSPDFPRFLPYCRITKRS